jgi:hypothetical protein
MIASTAFAILIGGVAYYVGATTRIFITPEATPGAFEAGLPVADRLMPELLTNVIPEALAVVILLLILSASMSTLAALVLISSSSFAKDFYAGFINKNISDRSLTALMRVMSAFFVFSVSHAGLYEFRFHCCHPWDQLGRHWFIFPGAVCVGFIFKTCEPFRGNVLGLRWAFHLSHPVFYGHAIAAGRNNWYDLITAYQSCF